MIIKKYFLLFSMNRSIFFVVLIHHFFIFGQRDHKVDSLVVKGLEAAKDTVKVYNVKTILGNKYLYYKYRFDFVPSINPLNPKKSKRISSEFGLRFHPIDKKNKPHLGLDISAKKGTAIHASASGTVIETFTSDTGYGNQVVILHDHGFKTRYAHMHSFIVKKGDTVKKGKIIGFVGNTGKSEAPHLHYEVIKNDRRIDPYPFCFFDL